MLSGVVISSIITGAVYTLTALGLVAVYKTTRVFNFAHGLMSGFCSYLTFQVVGQWHMPFIVGVLTSVACGAAIGYLVERLILARMYQRSPLELVIATFGVSLLLQFAVIKTWGYTERAVRDPFSGASLHLLGAEVPYYGLMVIALSIFIVAIMSLVLLRTQIGLKFRASFNDPVAARLTGINVSRMRSISWAVGGGLAGIAGSLLSPLLILSPDGMNTILITAFAAAVIGGFSSFYGSAVGGLAVALVLNLTGSYLSVKWSSLVLYGATVVLLWIRPRGLFGREDSSEEEVIQEGESGGGLFGSLRKMYGRLGTASDFVRIRLLRGIAPQWLVLVAALVIMFTGPQILGSTWRLSLSTWLIDFIAVAGLSLIMTYGGQFSLAQGGFMGVGAYSTAWIVENDPSRWPWAIVAATLGGGLLALIIAIPSTRVRGAYFGALTVVIALAFPTVVNSWSQFGGANGKVVSTPTWNGVTLTDQQLYYVVAVVAALVLVGLVAFRNSHLGHRMVLVTGAPRAASGIGASPFLWQGAIVAIGGTLGVLSGSVGALQSGIVAPSNFTLDLALILFVATVVGGSITGSLWGAALVVLVPVVFKGVQEYAIAMFGVSLIIALLILPFDMSSVDVLRRRRSRPQSIPAPPPEERTMAVAGALHD